MRLFARLANLLRGLASRWMGDRETRNPSAVYEAAIRDRVVQYGTLREAAAGVIYLRGKLERELQQRSGELARVRQQLDFAVERDDDPAALALLSRREVLDGDVGRLTAELTDLTAEADAAKRNLVAFQDEIVRLREERVRMLARLANAKARLKLHETLSGLSPEADIQALETVRDHVSRLVAEVALVREGGDPELERRLGVIRDAESAHAARAQLAELKRAKRAALVPVSLAPAAPVPAPAR
jgi:phage shock protein A